jgi:hypothetical protein
MTPPEAGRPVSGDKLPSDLSPAAGLVEPRLIRGEIPEPGRQIRKKKKSPWERHIQLAREFPARFDPINGTWSSYGPYSGGWVEVAAYLKGGPKARMEARDKDHRRLDMHLNKNFPLERFQVANRCDPGTWCDLHIYIRFLKTLTPEEDRLDRIDRRARYDAMMARRAEKAAERELERRRAERGQG